MLPGPRGCIGVVLARSISGLLAIVCTVKLCLSMDSLIIVQLHGGILGRFAEVLNRVDRETRTGAQRLEESGARRDRIMQIYDVKECTEM